METWHYRSDIYALYDHVGVEHVRAQFIVHVLLGPRRLVPTSIQ